MSDQSQFKAIPIQSYWPANYWRSSSGGQYKGKQGYAGPNGVVGPWELPPGFSYTGQVVKQLDRSQGQWYITNSGSHGPFIPCLVAPAHYKAPHDYLMIRRKQEGHKHGCYSWGVKENEGIDVWLLEHENSQVLNWLETQLKTVRAKLRL